MTRRVEVVQLEEGWLVKAWAKTAAEAEAIQRACRTAKPANDVAPDPVERQSPPPNCDGLYVAEILTERTAGDE